MGSVTVDRDGDIAVITLDEPETRNALSRPVVAGLLDFLAAARGDRTLRCIILTGAGPAFCSGGNVRDMRDGSDPMFRGKPHEMAASYRDHIQKLPLAFHALDIPVIAAVNGHAIGAGCDIACMADIRIASDMALFAESFLRVGLISGDGGAWFLPQVVGLPRALDMALTCRTVDAVLAERWGLVTSVVPADGLMDEARRIATVVASFPPVSTRLNKRLIRRSLGLSLEDSLDLAATFQSLVQSTADQQEAVAALLEKRQPQYRGT